ncbi:hypothetical protein TNCV_673291 [Trichonephila clavipes]|uniref:Mutator-like transposase domain-containing protein n=1 Tax=Trichonephila clavipes TaxID=2585209 RepID=A0A8X6WD12_TRICX|nr:hypothetical protein TNCV_673291 [Trichonephila clavipes]
MNLPTPSQRFNKKESGLNTAVETVATASMQIAAKEAKDVSGNSDIPVAIDGTWQKHGHTSLNGAAIVTSFYTDEVLDASIYQDFVSAPTKCIMRAVRLIILEIVEVWKFQEPSKSFNALKVCMVCDTPNFWEMVSPERIKQLTRCSRMEIQVMINWNMLVMSRNGWGIDYEL